MNIITLTTDLGLKDHYAAVLKGKIMQHLLPVSLMDISHMVEPFDVQQAAHVLASSWHIFPEGTTHLVAVNVQNSDTQRCIFFAHKGHYFAGPDNGIFPLAIESLPRDIFTIPFSGQLMDDIARVSASLADGAALTDIGNITGNIHVLQNLQPPIHSDMMRTNVVYIDHFGNVVLAVTEEAFHALRQERQFDIEFGKREHINKLSLAYSDVPEGEKLCLINNSKHLEIGINKGNAHELLGLKINDTVLIEFT